MKKFFKGFYHAFDGIKYAFQTQINMRFHFAVAAAVIIAGLIFKVSATDWMWISLSIALVISSELFNTAIESLTDLATKEIHPLAKVAKDCAAGAVLICSIFAVITGAFIFLPYVFLLLSN